VQTQVFGTTIVASRKSIASLSNKELDVLESGLRNTLRKLFTVRGSTKTYDQVISYALSRLSHIEDERVVRSVSRN